MKYLQLFESSIPKRKNISKKYESFEGNHMIFKDDRHLDGFIFAHYNIDLDEYYVINEKRLDLDPEYYSISIINIDKGKKKIDMRINGNYYSINTIKHIIIEFNCINFSYDMDVQYFLENKEIIEDSKDLGLI